MSHPGCEMGYMQLRGPDEQAKRGQAHQIGDWERDANSTDFLNTDRSMWTVTRPILTASAGLIYELSSIPVLRIDFTARGWKCPPNLALINHPFPMG